MKDNSRGKFLKALGVTATAGLPGCSSLLENDENNTSNPPSQNITSTRTNTETEDTDTPTEETPAYNQLELGGLAEVIQDSLYHRGYTAPENLTTADRQTLGDSDHLWINLSLNSVLNIAEVRHDREVEPDQDVYTASLTNHLDTLYDDIQGPVQEIVGIVDEEVTDFIPEKRTIPESKEKLNVRVKLHGARDSTVAVYNRDFEPGQNHDTATDEILQELEKEFSEDHPEHNPFLGFEGTQYDPLVYIPEEESLVVELGGDEHTFEVPYAEDREAVIRSNGNTVQREEGRKVGRFSGVDVYLENSNPIYMENGAELEFEGEEIEYTTLL